MNQLTRREFLKIFTFTGIAGNSDDMKGDMMLARDDMMTVQAPLTIEKRVGQLEIKVEGLERSRSYVYGSLGNLRNDVFDLKLKTARTPFYLYKPPKKGQL